MKPAPAGALPVSQLRLEVPPQVLIAAPDRLRATPFCKPLHTKVAALAWTENSKACCSVGPDRSGVTLMAR